MNTFVLSDSEDGPVMIDRHMGTLHARPHPVRLEGNIPMSEPHMVGNIPVFQRLHRKVAYQGPAAFA